MNSYINISNHFSKLVINYIMPFTCKEFNDFYKKD